MNARVAAAAVFCASLAVVAVPSTEKSGNGVVWEPVPRETGDVLIEPRTW